MMNSIFAELWPICRFSVPSDLREKITSPENWFPLLRKMHVNRKHIKKLVASFGIAEISAEEGRYFYRDLPKICDEILTADCSNFSSLYSLPSVIGEFPIHTRPINQAILAFNHEGMTFQLFKQIVILLKKHAEFCDADSVWQLLAMMVPYLNQPITEWFEHYPFLLYLPSSLPKIKREGGTINLEFSSRVIIKEESAFVKSDFPLNYDYNVSNNGRLALESTYFLANIFPQKIAGHFDAQERSRPRFLGSDEIFLLLMRQLSQHMETPKTPIFRTVLEQTLQALGMSYFPHEHQFDDYYVSPYLNIPLHLLSVEKVHSVLMTELERVNEAHLNLNENYQVLKLEKFSTEIITKYIYEFLHGLELAPLSTFGIGANMDGTIDYSNESRDLAFNWKTAEPAWRRKYRELSLHRQKPAERLMNASLGVKHESSIVWTSERNMCELQPTEYGTLLYDALLDNLITALLPDPLQVHNDKYYKYRKQWIQDTSGRIHFYYELSDRGIFFKRKDGSFNTTPYFRQSGTIDNIEHLPRRFDQSEATQQNYQDQQLAKMQMEYMENKLASVRGDLVYHPINGDQFVKDESGQLMLTNYGDLIPINGVIPKNFDTVIKQDSELCASFIVRMSRSSHIAVYCKTFAGALQEIKTLFLPLDISKAPQMPHLSPYLNECYQKLLTFLRNDRFDYEKCEKQFFSVLKNLIYGLYTLGQDDVNFKMSYSHLLYESSLLKELNRVNCEKVIRYLSVNKPETSDASRQLLYKNSMHFLRGLTEYFYPLPSEALVMLLEKIAKSYIAPLLASPAVQHYFAEMQKSPQDNLSKKQSPGMLLSTLSEDKSLKATVTLYQKMHHEQLSASYRTLDGYRLKNPEKHEVWFDFLTKKVGLTVRLLARYHLFSILIDPIIQPYLGAKVFQEKYPNAKFATLLGGGKGLLWNGLIKGTLNSLAFPLMVCKDMFYYFAQQNDEKPKNPLAIPAFADNLPSQKTEFMNDFRDFMLEKLSRKPSVHEFKISILKLIEKAANQQELLLMEQINFPLSDDECGELIDPFANIKHHKKLAFVLNKYHDVITANTVNAVFYALTQVIILDKTNINLIKKKFFLNHEEIQLLAEFFNLYDKTSDLSSKMSYINLFSFKGEFNQSLKKRHDYLVRVEQFVLKYLEQNNSVIKNSLGAKQIAERCVVDFLYREIKQELLPEKKVHHFFDYLMNLSCSNTVLNEKLTQIEVNYFLLINQENEKHLENFFNLSSDLISYLMKDMSAGNAEWHQKRILQDFKDFFHITMNALVNKALTALNREGMNNSLKNKNPLSLWLKELQQFPHEFKDFLNQQVVQSASLDHALLRLDAIFEAVEVGVALHKTGVQSLIRFWQNHPDNVTYRGKKYIDLDGFNRQLSPTLFSTSLTMKHSLSKVKEKGPLSSRFGQFK